MEGQKTQVAQDVPQLHHLPAWLLLRAHHVPQSGKKVWLLSMGLEISLGDKHELLNLGHAIFCAKACSPVCCTASCHSSSLIFGLAIVGSPRIRQRIDTTFSWFIKYLPVLLILDCKEPLSELNVLLNIAANKHAFQGFLALSYNCLPQMPDIKD